jgi:hypothetical protein
VHQQISSLSTEALDLRGAWAVRVKLGGLPPSGTEPEQEHVVQRRFPDTKHGGRNDLDEQHFDEELHPREHKMAGVAEG